VPPAKLRAIIFDIGRVLVRVDAARAVERLAPGSSLSPEEAWASLQKDPRWPDWQEGRVSPWDWYLHVSKRLGTSLAFDQFTAAWNAALDPQPIQDNAFLEKLSKRYRLALLSNTDPIHVAHMEATYDFFGLFPARVYSCSVGASKPNPLIYREALRACKVSAEEALYIDDIPAYAEAAQRLGMSGILFQSPEQLAADLRAHGVILD
jgi:HAD superfamily hydrolase (TIGR01509 family)